MTLVTNVGRCILALPLLTQIYAVPVPSLQGNNTTTSMSTEAPLLVQPLSGSGSTAWSPNPNFTTLDSFSISSYAAGVRNIQVLKGSPAPVPVSGNSSTPSTDSNFSLSTDDTDDTDTDTIDNVNSNQNPWEPSTNSIRILYPRGWINPGNTPQGGAEFYAHPLDLRNVNNATLEYSVYFPEDFDFVKGGKLPGLYGGHKGCSGGNAAVE